MTLHPLDGYKPSLPDTSSSHTRFNRRAKHREEDGSRLLLGVKDLAFLANVFNQRGAVGAVFRALFPYEIKPFEALVYRRLSRRVRSRAG